MMLAGLFIFSIEIWALFCLSEKVTGDKFCTMEEFLSRANPEDIFRLRHHTIQSWLGLCVLTMGRLFQ